MSRHRFPLLTPSPTPPPCGVIRGVLETLGWAVGSGGVRDVLDGLGRYGGKTVDRGGGPSEKEGRNFPSNGVEYV